MGLLIRYSASDSSSGWWQLPFWTIIHQDYDYDDNENDYDDDDEDDNNDEDNDDGNADDYDGNDNVGNILMLFT